MKKTNLPLIYELGSRLSALAKLNPETSDVWDLLTQFVDTRFTVQRLLIYFPLLPVSRPPALELIDTIPELMNLVKGLSSAELDQPHNPLCDKASEAITKARELETILTAELQTLAAYHVTQKGIYSTGDLIDRAENIFPTSALQKLTADVIEEVRQSARCLAFEVSTASAFHIMRATELVMQQYYISVCKPTAPAKMKLDSWGAYIAELQNSQAPEVKEVVAMLRQIKDRHRNLIMHPEVVLSPDEAFTLFEIAQAAIIAMADQLPAPKKT